MQVPKQQIAASPQDIANAFKRGWLALGYTSPPTPAQIGVLYSQWMVETGGKAFWNNNVGNVKVTQAQVDAGVPWFELPGTWEYVNGKKVVLPAGSPGSRFRAYPTLDEGMIEHMKFIRNGRYKKAWPAVEMGNPSLFAHALKAGGDGIEGTADDYFTAPVEDYVKGMQTHFNRWMQGAAAGISGAAKAAAPVAKKAAKVYVGFLAVSATIVSGVLIHDEWKNGRLKRTG